MNVNKDSRLIMNNKIYQDCLKDIYMNNKPLNSKQDQNSAAKPIVITPLYYFAIISLVGVLFFIS
jgi:hypothetical protein